MINSYIYDLIYDYLIEEDNYFYYNDLIVESKKFRDFVDNFMNILKDNYNNNILDFFDDRYQILLENYNKYKFDNAKLKEYNRFLKNVFNNLLNNNNLNDILNIAKDYFKFNAGYSLLFEGDLEYLKEGEYYDVEKMIKLLSTGFDYNIRIGFTSLNDLINDIKKFINSFQNNKNYLDVANVLEAEKYGYNYKNIEDLGNKLIDDIQKFDLKYNISKNSFKDLSDYKSIALDNKNSNKGENNIMENEKKKAMWVTIPERYIHEFTKEFTSDQKGNALPEHITKKYYAVNIPTKDGKNMSFFVNAKVQHPQVKNYAIIPINEGERGVTFSHLEKDENGKNSYVKEEPVVKLSQSHLSEIVKDAFNKINDEAIKYLIVPKDNVDEKSFYSYDVDGHKESKSAFKVTLPNYMQDYQGHKLAGATMLAPFQYENTKDENLAVFRIEENATIKLWANGDENRTFNITGKELIDINKRSYKESKKEASKGTDLDQEELPTLKSAGNIKDEAVCIDCMINGKTEGKTQENTYSNENKGEEYSH